MAGSLETRERIAPEMKKLVDLVVTYRATGSKFTPEMKKFAASVVMYEPLEKNVSLVSGE